MTAPAPAPAAPKGRLGNGQLRRQVAEYLADHPGPQKAGDIAKALGRSAGAVGNALTTLAGNGEADLVPGKPTRYQANPATAAAAAAIAPKAPLPPRAAPAPAPAAPAPPPAPTPAFTPKPAAAGPVTRPNGQVYQPRALAGMPDVEVLRKLRANGVPALLEGSPGTGKTSLIEAAFGGRDIRLHGDDLAVPGDRVALEHTDDPHTRLRPGDEGTVTRYDPRLGQLHVNWDSGSTLAMLLNDGDRVRLIAPAPGTGEAAREPGR